MRVLTPLLPVLASLLGGCALLGIGADLETDTDPPPPPLTARLVADAYLQDCRWTEEDWLGVESLRITLEHRLDGAPERTLPAPDVCVSGLELFAEEELAGGDGLPGVSGRPPWAGAAGSGPLEELFPGLWHASAFQSPERCGTLDESVGEGIELVSAGALTEVGTPPPALLETAALDGARFVDRVGPLARGDTVSLTWDADGWDAAFVQLRRLHDGELRQAITCGASGGAATLDDAAWDLVDDARFAEDNALYLGLVREDEVETLDGSARVTVVTRAIHVLKPPRTR